jgi:hypothetical protein
MTAFPVPLFKVPSLTAHSQPDQGFAGHSL